MLEQAKAKLEEQDLNMDQLKEIAKSVGVKNSHLMRSKAKVIDAISETIEATDSPLDVLVYEANEPTDDSQTKAVKKSKDPVFIKDFPRRKVVIHPLTEVDMAINENIFSVNEYQANIVFGKEVNLPMPMITHIKGLKTSSNRIIDGKPVAIEIPRFSVGEA